MTLDPGVVVAVISALTAALGAAMRMIYSDLKRDRDLWRDAFLASVGRTEEAISVAKKAARG